MYLSPDARLTKKNFPVTAKALKGKAQLELFDLNSGKYNPFKPQKQKTIRTYAQLKNIEHELKVQQTIRSIAGTKQREEDKDSFKSDSSLNSKSSKSIDDRTGMRRRTLRMPYIDKCKPTEQVIKKVETKYNENLGSLSVPLARQRTKRMSDSLRESGKMNLL